ncbi:histone acetyltransferase MCC1 isoform X3 [Daucus carota subsp. sativus]|uniref:histone acetyltransferase MCC1 isoform X3 n=1 Tax=Daucus carota subsp. sativus TaxID=79200 RepID=UPI003082AF2E
MVNLYKPPCASIFYRPIRPSDLQLLEKLHADLFPIRYESEFYLNVVHGRDIVSWGAVDRNRSDGLSDQLIGFVTARLVMAKGSDCVRRLHAFYFINGQHYDSYLFIYYVNGGRSPCSPLCVSRKTLETQKITFSGGQLPFPLPKKAISWQRELATIFIAYIRCGFKAAASKLWRKKDKKVPVWMKCKESSGLLPTTQNKRILTSHN